MKRSRLPAEQSRSTPSLFALNTNEVLSSECRSLSTRATRTSFAMPRSQSRGPPPRSRSGWPHTTNPWRLCAHRTPTWRKSRFSSNGVIRDSKNPTGPGPHNGRGGPEHQIGVRGPTRCYSHTCHRTLDHSVSGPRPPGAAGASRGPMTRSTSCGSRVPSSNCRPTFT